LDHIRLHQEPLWQLFGRLSRNDLKGRISILYHHSFDGNMVQEFENCNLQVTVSTQNKFDLHHLLK
jgi:hypothetical protein